MFVQTLVFVSFNKVCTAQYFIWYHALLPLILPSSAALLRAERSRSLLAASVWVITLLAWLGVAHQLEFRARNVLFLLWLAGLAFFAANVFIVREAIRLVSVAAPADKLRSSTTTTLGCPHAGYMAMIWHVDDVAH